MNLALIDRDQTIDKLECRKRFIFNIIDKNICFLFLYYIKISEYYIKNIEIEVYLHLT